MAAEFSKVSALILAAEGGYVDSKNDYGNATKYGISQRQYPRVDIAAITPDGALAILERDYWNHYHCDEINDQVIATKCSLCSLIWTPYMLLRLYKRPVTKLVHASNSMGSWGRPQ